ncbi:hypothetical protein M0R45_037128 [Rubus argutus]|uniref:Uncharacterized protein n=1 Tax=Rubus argutus TaxID=59490 RepID=A0AAW1W0R3_RUBAR
MPALPRSIGLGTHRSCSLAPHMASQPISSPNPICLSSGALPQLWLLSLSSLPRLHPPPTLPNSKRPPPALFEPRSKTIAQPPTPIQIASPLTQITHAQSRPADRPAQTSVDFTTSKHQLHQSEWSSNFSMPSSAIASPFSNPLHHLCRAFAVAHLCSPFLVSCS